MSTNPYQPPQEESYSADDESAEWSQQQRRWFLAAAILAFYLVTSYVIAVLDDFFDLGLPPEVQLLVWPGGYFALMIHLLIYIVWVARSRELTGLDKVCWIGILLCFNVLAIPVFLWTKYRRTTAHWVRPRGWAGDSNGEHHE